MTLRAGFGKIELAGAAAGVELVGYANREGPATGVRDPLHARALVLEEDGRRVALCALELCYAMEDVVAAARERVAARGLRAGGRAAARRHAYAQRALRRRRGGLPRGLDALVEQAVAQACERLEPARLGVGSGTLHGHSINRRRLEDPVDPALFVAARRRGRRTPARARPRLRLPSGRARPRQPPRQRRLAGGRVPAAGGARSARRGRALPAGRVGRRQSAHRRRARAAGGRSRRRLDRAARRLLRPRGATVGRSATASAGRSPSWRRSGARSPTRRCACAAGSRPAPPGARGHPARGPARRRPAADRADRDDRRPPPAARRTRHAARGDARRPRRRGARARRDAGRAVRRQRRRAAACAARGGRPASVRVSQANGRRAYLPPRHAFADGGYEVEWARTNGIPETVQDDMRAAVLEALAGARARRDRPPSRSCRGCGASAAEAGTALSRRSRSRMTRTSTCCAGRPARCSSTAACPRGRRRSRPTCARRRRAGRDRRPAADALALGSHAGGARMAGRARAAHAPQRGRRRRSSRAATCGSWARRCTGRTSRSSRSRSTTRLPTASI